MPSLNVQFLLLPGYYMPGESEPLFKPHAVARTRIGIDLDYPDSICAWPLFLCFVVNFDASCF